MENNILLKCLITVVLSYCIPLFLFSQSDKNFQFGAQIGLSRTTITAEARTGWQENYLVGMIGQMHLSKNFLFVAELNYERKGIDSAHTPLGTGRTFSVHEYFNYLTGNVLGEAHYGDEYGLMLGVGAYQGYLISRKNISQSDLNTNYDGGLLFRVGYFHNFLNGRQCKIYLSHSHGLVNVDEDGGTVKNLNRSFMLVMGYVF
jgi:hypothetical protein